MIDVDAAARNWATRFLAHGVDYNDYVATTGRIDSWSNWLDAWVDTGETHAQIARAAQDEGHSRTAGEAWVRAALSWHFASFLWLEDLQRYRDTRIRSVEALRAGMSLLDPTFERLEIALRGGDGGMVANLRRPREHPRPGVVVLVPGMDSTKEEFPAWEATFLDRGLATISLDGPGQGEAGFHEALRPDYEVPLGALLDLLAERSDLDLRRVGITGMGLGGYLAARGAAFEPRIAAVGVVGGAYQFPRMPEIIRRKFMHSTGIDDPTAAAEYAARFTLEGVARRIVQPYLVIHGQHDKVMDPAEAERPALAAPNGRFVLYPEGNTVCQSVSHLVRPFLADWFRTQLDEVVPVRRPDGRQPLGSRSRSRP